MAALDSCQVADVLAQLALECSARPRMLSRLEAFLLASMYSSRKACFSLRYSIEQPPWWLIPLSKPDLVSNLGNGSARSESEVQLSLSISSASEQSLTPNSGCERISHSVSFPRTTTAAIVTLAFEAVDGGLVSHCMAAKLVQPAQSTSKLEISAKEICYSARPGSALPTPKPRTTTPTCGKHRARGRLAEVPKHAARNISSRRSGNQPKLP